MAERRMFAKTIIDSDAFLEMPATSQLLYFHLSMRADDEGFVNKPKSIMRTVGCRDDDLSVLCAKGFIIPFESGIVVIKHWYIHNWIREDRKHITKYEDERKTLLIKENGAYTMSDKCLPCVSQPSDNCHTEVRLGEDSLGKDRIDNADKPRKSTREFIPPSLQEVKDYAAEKNLDFDPTKFMSYYTESEWHDSQGKKVKNWKQKAITWSGRGKGKTEPKKEVSNADRYAITEGFKTSF